MISVTRFGEISPLWQNFKSLPKMIDGLFSIWQILNLLWQILYAIGMIYAVVSGQILNNNWACGHTENVQSSIR